MDINELFDRTAIVKGEESIMTTLALLFLQRPVYEQAQLAGSMAAKMMILPKFKGRLPVGTDLDFVFREIPSQLKRDLKKRHLIDRAERKYLRDRVIEHVEFSEHVVYDLPEKRFALVDTFDSSMGALRLPELGAVNVKYDLGTRAHRMQIAHPGFLAACNLYAGGLKRLNRLRFLLETAVQENQLNIDYSALSEGCKHTLDINNMGKKELEETLRQVNHHYRHITLYRDFVQKVVT